MVFFCVHGNINLGEARDLSRASPKFISHERRKKDAHSLYLQYLQIKDFILKAPDKKLLKLSLT